MKLVRARPLRFDLEKQPGRPSSFIVQPATVGQLRECIERDPKPEDEKETPTARLTRLTDQAVILGLDRELAEKLDQFEIRQIRTALIVHAHGIDPNDVAAAEALLKKKAKAASPARTKRRAKS